MIWALQLYRISVWRYVTTSSQHHLHHLLRNMFHLHSISGVSRIDVSFKRATSLLLAAQICYQENQRYLLLVIAKQLCYFLSLQKLTDGKNDRKEVPRTYHLSAHCVPKINQFHTKRNSCLQVYIIKWDCLIYHFESLHNQQLP